MTNPPGDLATFRTKKVIPATGLQGNDVGINPDRAHLEDGGYHCGCTDIQQIGRWDRDYSTRQGRDRIAGTNLASAMDIGDDWPNGGRKAWLRFNNLLVSQLRAGDPALAALRAVNFSPDGTLRCRYDSLHPEQGVIPSTDSVDIHTHLEWWRNTVGTAARARSLARVGQIIDAAIRNTPVPPERDEDDMGFTLNDDETNVPVPGGGAWRDTWLQITNDTGFGNAAAPAYALRIFAKPYGGDWTPYGGTTDGMVKFASGETKSWQLPTDTRCVSIRRMAIDELGKVVPPLGPGQTGTPRSVYSGPLSGVLERP